MYDAGVSLTDIKVLGHWSIGVLDAYLSYKESALAMIQKKGILRAEQRTANHWTSKIMVFLRRCLNSGIYISLLFLPAQTRLRSDQFLCLPLGTWVYEGLTGVL